MDSLKIILKDLDQNQEPIFYSVNFSTNIRVEWRAEASKDVDLYYQITFRNNDENINSDVYYFVNQLFINGLLGKKLDNIDSIIITQGETSYTISGINLFSINTNSSNFGSEVMLVLKDLEAQTNLPFIINNDPVSNLQSTGLNNGLMNNSNLEEE